jgi:hypothetical protein
MKSFLTCRRTWSSDSFSSNLMLLLDMNIMLTNMCMMAKFVIGTIPKIVAYLSCSSGRTNFALTNYFDIGHVLPAMPKGSSRMSIRAAHRTDKPMRVHNPVHRGTNLIMSADGKGELCYCPPEGKELLYLTR